MCVLDKINCEWKYMIMLFEFNWVWLFLKIGNYFVLLMEEKNENYFLGGLGLVFYFEIKIVL